MAQRHYGNNLSTTITSAIGASDTSIVLASATGWPSPSGGSEALATLDDGAGSVEIVKITARSGTTITVTRAQQGTTARTWPSGTTIEQRWTAGDAGRVDSYVGPTLTEDGQLAIDSNYAVLWYRVGGTTERAARAPAAGTAAANGLVIYDSSNGGVLATQTAWSVTGNAALVPTSSACRLGLPPYPAIAPTPATAGYVWWDSATSEIVVDTGSALVRFGAGGGGSTWQDVFDADPSLDVSADDLQVDGGGGSVLIGAIDAIDAFTVASTGAVSLTTSTGNIAFNASNGEISLLGDTVEVVADAVSITGTSPVAVVGGLAVTGAISGTSTLSVTGQVSGSRFVGPAWLPDTDASHSLILAPGSNLTANRTLTITTGDVDRTLQLDANVQISAFGATLVDDADASAARTTLGLGALATLGSVGTTQITDDAVTLPKIADISNKRVLGNLSGSSASPSELTASQVRELIGDASARVFEYFSSTTITLPSGCTGNEWCRFELWACGGPGGSGRRGAAGSTRGAGGGGGASGYAVWEGTLSTLVGLSLTIGAQGTVGAAVTTDDTNGAAGVAGSASTLGSLLNSQPGGAGGGGTTSGGTAGNAGVPNSGGIASSGVAGGGSAGGTGNPGVPRDGHNGNSGGGSGGAGINVSNTAGTPNAGGKSSSGSDGGAAGAAGGGAGGDGDAHGSGGGGGRPSAGGVGYAGGAGTRYGAGGGGGSASLNGNNSGAGGQGAPAEARLVVFT